MNFHRMITKRTIGIIALTLFVGLYHAYAKEVKDPATKIPVVNTYSNVETWKKIKFKTAQDELQNIYTILSCAVVYKDWQTTLDSTARGYNIGCVLLDPQGKLVFWARNCNIRTQNNTNHGEVQCMRNYIDQFKTKTVKGYTLYTSLEPCAMCSGMMTLQQLGTTVYAQDDPDFGDALQRLQLDSTSINGYKPYPANDTSGVYHPTPIASSSIVRKVLDSSYEEYLRKGYPRKITQWLTTDDCRMIYSNITDWFLQYTVQFPENKQKLADAQAFFTNISGKCYMNE